MIPSRTTIVVAAVLLCAAAASAQIEDVELEFSSGGTMETDVVDCRAGILTTVQERYVGEWYNTRLVDTVHIALDSVRTVQLSEGSSGLGTFLGYLVGYYLAGGLAGALVGGYGGAVVALAAWAVGTVVSIVEGIDAASEPEIYSPVVSHDAMVLERRLRAAVASDVAQGDTMQNLSVRELVPKLEFTLKNGTACDGRLLYLREGNASVLIEDASDLAMKLPAAIMTIPLSELERVGRYDRSTTAPWGTLLIGGFGLLAVTLATDANEHELGRNALLTVGTGLLLDIIMGVRSATSPSWEWESPKDATNLLWQMSLHHALEVGNAEWD